MNYPWAEKKIIEHCKLLSESYFFWTKNELIGVGLEENELSFLIYHAPFAVVSHGTEKDPVFNYANKKAQELWRLSWENFIKMPSRLSAEPVEAEHRQHLLEDAIKKGFIANYSGVRISGEGKKFMIQDTILWSTVEAGGKYMGQAATFREWKFI
jgi:hypothetical protein